MGLGVGELHRRAFHKVGRRRQHGAPLPVVQGQLGAADGVHYHAGRVGAVPHFQLHFHLDGRAAKHLAVNVDVAPFAVLQPRHVVAGADVDGVGVGFLGHLAGHGAGLGDFLGHQAFPFQHIEEIGVAAEVELVGIVDFGAPVFHQPGQHPVDDGGADLRLDVVADDRHAAFLKAVPPVILAGDEHGDAVDHSAAGVQDLLHIPFGGHLAAHRQVVDDHIHLALPQDAGNIRRAVGGFDHRVRQIAADAVVGHPPLHGHAHMGDVGELDGVVRLGENGLGQVFAHLVAVDVEGGDDLNVLNAVFPDAVMHHAGDGFVIRRLNIFVDALHQG